MEKKFSTMFNAEGWFLYFVGAALINMFAGFVSTILPFLISNNLMATNLSFFISLGRGIIVIVLYALAYSEALLAFLNTLSLAEKKFAISIDSNSFLFFVLANVIISVVTLGLYAPWAVKAIIDKVLSNLKYEGEGSFSFRSKASSILGFLIIFIIVIFFLTLLLGGSFVVAMKYSGSFALLALLFAVVLGLAFFAMIAFWQVFLFNWFCNVQYTSAKKNTTYTLDINIGNAVFFCLGQLILLIITLGFYVGVYQLNMYTYFCGRITEKEGNSIIGHMVFRKPNDKGATFLFLQAFLSVISFGIYTPFALVEYAKFFINNTYLQTKNEEVFVV